MNKLSLRLKIALALYSLGVTIAVFYYILPTFISENNSIGFIVNN